ncbi:MAG: hypothetical protein HWN68_16085 [Desulfobacterales bacterium]|nr:hypothetical protein [Desulfobacterales bacterium]
MPHLAICIDDKLSKNHWSQWGLENHGTLTCYGFSCILGERRKKQRGQTYTFDKKNIRVSTKNKKKQVRRLGLGTTRSEACAKPNNNYCARFRNNHASGVADKIILCWVALRLTQPTKLVLVPGIVDGLVKSPH